MESDRGRLSKGQGDEWTAKPLHDRTNTASIIRSTKRRVAPPPPDCAPFRFPNEEHMDFFRGDKPLPSLPKDMGAKFTAGLASMANRAPPSLPNKPKPSATSGPSSSRPAVASSNMVSNARSMFETAVKYVPKDKAVDLAKAVPTSTYVSGLQQAHPSMKGVPLGGLIDRAKKVDTNTYVGAINTYEAYNNSSSTATTSQQATSSVSALKSQLENKLVLGPPRPAQTTNNAAHQPPSRPTPPRTTQATTAPTPSSYANYNSFSSPTPSLPSGPYAVASFEFAAGASDEVALTVDDVFLLERTVDADWVYGRNDRTKKLGIAPVAYLTVKRALADQPVRSAPIAQGPRAEVLYDYKSGVPTDLTLNQGDVVRLLEQVDADWMKGQTVDGRMGLFPSNYVNVIEPLPVTSAQNDDTSVCRTAVALYDYDTGQDGDLVFRTGDSVEIVRVENADWAVGRLSSQRAIEGLFPLNYVTDESTTGGVGHIVTCICDYRGDTADDLWMSVGDKVRVTEVLDEHWYRGQLQLDLSSTRNIPTGLFPRTYVE